MARAARTAAEIAQLSLSPVRSRLCRASCRRFIAWPSQPAHPAQTNFIYCVEGTAPPVPPTAASSRSLKPSEEQREIFIVTGDGRRYSYEQPSLRYGIHVVAEDGTKRQSGSSGGGGRDHLQFFDCKTPEHYAREATPCSHCDARCRRGPSRPAPGRARRW